MNTSLQKSWKVLFIFLLALGLRLVYLYQARANPFHDGLITDSLFYDAWARQIAAGDWVGQGVFTNTPFYPYFLAVVYRFFGHSLLAVR